MKRIQRKRTKGWKMPPNTIYVGRPTKWGNPFKIGVLHNLTLYLLGSRKNKKGLIKDSHLIREGKFFIDRKLSLEMYNNMLVESFLKRAFNPMWRIELKNLKGKNLACWCPLSEPCHADILLKIANNQPL